MLHYSTFDKTIYASETTEPLLHYCCATPSLPHSFTPPLTHSLTHHGEAPAPLLPVLHPPQTKSCHTPRNQSRQKRHPTTPSLPHSHSLTHSLTPLLTLQPSTSQVLLQRGLLPAGSAVSSGAPRTRDFFAAGAAECAAPQHTPPAARAEPPPGGAPLTHSLTHSLSHSLTYTLTHSLTYTLTHSLTHSLSHVHTCYSYIYSLTYSLTHSLAHRVLTLSAPPTGRRL